MTQKSIEILIGRLATDESFRVAYQEDAAGTLASFADQGHDLTAVEIAALKAVADQVWTRLAEHIDPRLQKANLSRCGGDHGD